MMFQKAVSVIYESSQFWQISYSSVLFCLLPPNLDADNEFVRIIIIIYLFKVDLIYNNFVYNKYNKK